MPSSDILWLVPGCVDSGLFYDTFTRLPSRRTYCALHVINRCKKNLNLRRSTGSKCLCIIFVIILVQHRRRVSHTRNRRDTVEDGDKLIKVSSTSLKSQQQHGDH